MGFYDDEGGSGYQWLPFVFSSAATDEELEEHFKNDVYYGEYGVKLTKTEHVDIHELREGYHYGTKKRHKIIVA